MNSNTFKQHYISLLKKLVVLRQARNNLQYAGDKICNSQKYFEELTCVNEQIAKYQRCQDALLEGYNNDLKQTA